MIELNLGEYAAVATIVGTLGAGLVFVTKKLSRKNKPDKPDVDSSINNNGIQISAEKGGSVNVNGGINNNINQFPSRIPDALARPSINIRQVGFFNGGYQGKTSYTLEATNSGGDFYSLEIVFLHKTVCSSSCLRRGGSVKFTLDLNDRPECINIVFSGVDGNGEKVSLAKNGVLVGSTQSDYEF